MIPFVSMLVVSGVAVAAGRAGEPAPLYAYVETVSPCDVFASTTTFARSFVVCAATTTTSCVSTAAEAVAKT